MAKISLCLIVGNVEEYIERCLESFLPLADEVVLVRAIGNNLKDGTESIAKGVCREAKIPIIFADYKNKPGHEDWPHVDDFAAARQMSFDLASHEWCFWCDTDDVLENSEASAKIIRDLAARGGYATFQFPYNIFGRGICLPKPRLLLKDSGKWLYPVHEYFEFHVKPAQGWQEDRVVITHLPHANKSGSNERNLRILKSIPEAEMTTGLWYHLHVELVLAKDIAGSVAVAKRVLAQADLGKPEKCELFLNLAQADDNPERKAVFWHQAYAADPRRREALYLLCNHAMNYGEPDTALAYARQMMATLPPAQMDWNERAAIYGWAGNDIFTQALRVNGRSEHAEQMRLQSFDDAGGPRISLIHATRGRPQQAALCRKVWLDMAAKPDQVEHIFVFDHDDKESHVLRRFHHLELPPGGGCVSAWNHGALLAGSDVLVQLSDDWTPPPKWDELILERLGDVKKPSVLAVSDGTRADQLLCMAICTREYFARDWFLFHPWFTGVWSDNWFTEQAYERKAVIEARDLVFTHSHPAFGSAKMDQTYAEQNAPARYEQGEKVITELRRRADWSSVPGWFNYWPFYQRIAQQLKDGDTVCEIGCWLGRSLIYLAQECQRLGKDVKFIAVDTFKGEAGQPEHEKIVSLNGGSLRAAFEANLKRCGVADRVRVIEGDSAESAKLVEDGSLAFCYVDAAHDYASVKRDIAAWKAKVKPGGTLAGHDAQWPDVKQAVLEALPAAKIFGVVWTTPI